tara:strand:+ start:17016 stop:17948 length:933 start_codon:yes stop_codon:yes gene_type:complete
MFPIVLISIVISTILSIGFNKFFIKKNIIDIINKRSSHKVTATRSGGLSIFLTLFLITLYYYINSNQIFDFSLIIPLGILLLIGVYDDIYKADFKLKFIFQLIAAKIIVDQGVILESLNGFLGIYEITYMYGQFFTIFLIVLISNAINFTDGIDGLAITETLKSLLIIYFVHTNLTSNIIILIVASAIVPLYYFNFKTNNKVFLGDGGSLFLGGLISYVLINFLNYNSSISGNINSIILILICCLYPLADLIRVVVIRVINKKSPFDADKNHIHHYFLRRGYSQVKSTLIITLVTLIFQISLLWYLNNWV